MFLGWVIAPPSSSLVMITFDPFIAETENDRLPRETNVISTERLLKNLQFDRNRLKRSSLSAPDSKHRTSSPLNPCRCCTEFQFESQSEAISTVVLQYIFSERLQKVFNISVEHQFCWLPFTQGRKLTEWHTHTDFCSFINSALKFAYKLQSIRSLVTLRRSPCFCRAKQKLLSPLAAWHHLISTLGFTCSETRTLLN